MTEFESIKDLEIFELDRPASFLKPPQLCFLEGLRGNFAYKEIFMKEEESGEFNDPNSSVGIIFVKNKTSSAITRKLSFGGATNRSADCEGVWLFLGSPNNTNTNKLLISDVTWTNLYHNTKSDKELTASARVNIPADKTVAIMLYTSGYDNKSTPYHKAPYYSKTLYWHIKDFRIDFLTEGLEIDVDRTIKAWQGMGYKSPYEIWK